MKGDEEDEEKKHTDPPVRVVDRRWWARGDAAPSDDRPSRKPTVVEDLEQRLADSANQLQAYVADHRRSLEEFEQVKMRLRRDVSREVERGKRTVLVELLEVVDNLDRAIWRPTTPGGPRYRTRPIASLTASGSFAISSWPSSKALAWRACPRSASVSTRRSTRRPPHPRSAIRQRTASSSPSSKRDTRSAASCFARRRSWSENMPLPAADLVERRRKYIERQIALDNGAVNVTFRDRRPEGSGALNRRGIRDCLSASTKVKNWPVLDLGEQPDVATRTWALDVGGLVENPFTLTWDQFLALPQADDVSDFIA